MADAALGGGARVSRGGREAARDGGIEDDLDWWCEVETGLLLTGEI
jgi:hypothetical protein